MMFRHIKCPTCPSMKIDISRALLLQPQALVHSRESIKPTFVWEYYQAAHRRHIQFMLYAFAPILHSRLYCSAYVVVAITRG